MEFMVRVLYINNARMGSNSSEGKWPHPKFDQTEIS